MTRFASIQHRLFWWRNCLAQALVGHFWICLRASLVLAPLWVRVRECNSLKFLASPSQVAQNQCHSIRSGSRPCAGSVAAASGSGIHACSSYCPTRCGLYTPRGSLSSWPRRPAESSLLRCAGTLRSTHGNQRWQRITAACWQCARPGPYPFPGGTLVHQFVPQAVAESPAPAPGGHAKTPTGSPGWRD